MTEDPVLMERVHAKVNEAYMILTDTLTDPEKFSNPLVAMMTFTHIVEALRDALSLLEGKG